MTEKEFIDICESLGLFHENWLDEIEEKTINYQLNYDPIHKNYEIGLMGSGTVVARYHIKTHEAYYWKDFITKDGKGIQCLGNPAIRVTKAKTLYDGLNAVIYSYRLMVKDLKKEKNEARIKKMEKDFQ